VAKKTAKKSAKKTAVTKKVATAVGPVRNLAARAQQLAGRGLETVTQQDLALPFLAVLQAMSPQVQRGQEKYVKGAQAGDFFNTVTGETYTGYDEDGDADGVRLIPCYFEKAYNLWVPRDEGGGFRGSFPTRADAERAAAELEENVDIVDTANHYCLIEQEDGSWTEAVFSMTSTKLSTSRQWNTIMKQQKMVDETTGEKFTPPSFMRVYHGTTVVKTNDKGTFYVPKIVPDAWVEDETIFEQAENFYRMFVDQGVKVSYDNADLAMSDPEDEDDDPEY
jgi:hypothetical protein